MIWLGMAAIRPLEPTTGSHYPNQVQQYREDRGGVVLGRDNDCLPWVLQVETKIVFRLEHVQRSGSLIPLTPTSTRLAAVAMVDLTCLWFRTLCGPMTPATLSFRPQLCRYPLPSFHG